MCLAWCRLEARVENLTPESLSMSGRIPVWWENAHDFLAEDDLLGPVVEEFGPEGITSRDDLFQTLVRSIVGQQISVLAADAIWGRLVAHLGCVVERVVGGPVERRRLAVPRPLSLAQRHFDCAGRAGEGLDRRATKLPRKRPLTSSSRSSNSRLPTPAARSELRRPAHRQTPRPFVAYLMCAS